MRWAKLAQVASVSIVRGGRTVPFGSGLIFGVASLVFGIVVMIFPKILNYLVGIYLIIVGLIAIFAR